MNKKIISLISFLLIVIMVGSASAGCPIRSYVNEHGIKVVTNKCDTGTTKPPCRVDENGVIEVTGKCDIGTPQSDRDTQTSSDSDSYNGYDDDYGDDYDDDYDDDYGDDYDDDYGDDYDVDGGDDDDDDDDERPTDDSNNPGGPRSQVLNLERTDSLVSGDGIKGLTAVGLGKINMQNSLSAVHMASKGFRV